MPAPVSVVEHPPAARPASWTTSGPTFIGRDAEVKQLSRVWAAAREGARGAVLLGGEPGIGKTRLAAESRADRGG